MNWKYYIPHAWEEDRQTWEDFYLLPCDPDYSGESIWLTIDALGDGSEGRPIEGEYFEIISKKMEGKDYVINGTDMTVRGIDFSKNEFLKWVRTWLEDNGFEVAELLEAPLEDFEGTNQHASIVGECKAAMEDLKSLDAEELDKRLVSLDNLDLSKYLDHESEEE